MFNGNEIMSVGFQGTVSASTSGIGPEVFPHHPLTCQTELLLHEDMSMECCHSKAPANHPRTQAAVIHSIATLIIELAVQKFSGEVPSPGTMR